MGIIAFPRLSANTGGPTQAPLVITLASAVTSFLQGGPANYVDIRAWKTAQGKTASPILEVVLEFAASVAQTIGNGTTQQIGLFGGIIIPGSPATIKKSLLGVLGVNLGTTQPQIPIISTTIGYSQPVCNVALYDYLAIGSVGTDIALDVGNATVVARPVLRSQG